MTLGDACDNITAAGDLQHFFPKESVLSPYCRFAIERSQCAGHSTASDSKWVILQRDPLATARGTVAYARGGSRPAGLLWAFCVIQFEVTAGVADYEDHLAASEF